MKNVFKILVAVTLVFSFSSCTDNEEIVTENGQIINIQGIDKEDIIAPGEEGEDDDIIFD